MCTARHNQRDVCRDHRDAEALPKSRFVKNPNIFWEAYVWAKQVVTLAMLRFFGSVPISYGLPAGIPHPKVSSHFATRLGIPSSTQ